jgi:FlaA1/EpsC-like NDP-sugar epimerase
MVMKNGSLYKNFILVMVVDAILLAASWYSAYLLRFNFQIPAEYLGAVIRALPLIVICKIIIFYLLNLYKGMWRYTSIGDLFNIVRAAIVSSLVIVSFIFFTRSFGIFSRSAFVIDWVLTIVLISGYRLGIRLYFWLDSRENTSLIDVLRLFASRQHIKIDAKNLLIIGAGDCGEKIYREIRDNAGLQYNIIGFIDDDFAKVGRKIHGINVLGTTKELKTICGKMNADEALIAIPSATSQQMRSIVSYCEQTNVPFKTVPGLGELINGKVTVNGIRDVDYRDLLGREVIHLDEESIGGYLENARVLVTGAGGSIGSELCRQICRYRPARLVLYERAESPLYEIDLELKRDFSNIEIIPLLADVRNRHELSRAFTAFKPQVVFHAAAYKHVPMLELQPWKAVENNIVGTSNLVGVSKEHSVERFVFVSTDKAVRPANIMGASKRVSELIVQGQNGRDLSQNRFMAVRFGNVVGSVGSVVPLFKKQIEKGGPVTVTHPEVSRYFMTIPEACQLILQTGAIGQGGEIFVLDMGIPIKIDDMARDLIRLSGFEPDVGIKIEYVGLRPGEKLYEELITEDEGVVPTSHKQILSLKGLARDQIILNGKIEELAQLAQNHQGKEIKLKLLEIVPEYIPRETAEERTESPGTI